MRLITFIIILFLFLLFILVPASGYFPFWPGLRLPAGAKVTGCRLPGPVPARPGNMGPGKNILYSPGNLSPSNMGPG